MTLFKQIYSLLFGLFLLVLSSLTYFQFTETRDFMTNQMEVELNNTTTSLSLMLKPHLQTGDVAAVNTLVNVIFEGGFYREVKLLWLADNKTQTWNNPVKIVGVPDWFVSLNLFDVQRQEITITSGWLQLATLSIEAHPGYGYQELWRVMNNTLMVISILFLLSLVVLHFRLKSLLQPLHDIAKHASDIALRIFNPNMPLPKTHELSEVVQAINSMSDQLKQVFSTLDQEVETLRHDNLVDPVSQLANRQCLMGQMNSWLTDPGFGGLVLVKMDWLDDLHSQFGYQIRDETIFLLGQRLQDKLPAEAESVIARVAKTEFAFMLTKGDKKQIKVYVQALIRIINQEMSKAGCVANTGYNIGIAIRTGEAQASTLLTQADNSLQMAIAKNTVTHWFDHQEQQELNREQWRQRLLEAINKKQFTFQWQPIMHTDKDEVLQRELYCQLTIEGQSVRAGQFMPYVELFSIGSQLDRCLLECVAKTQILSLHPESIAINLTHDSLEDKKFHLWLGKFLQVTPLVNRLYFELPESGVKQNLANAVALSKIIKAHGAKLGIDHCGRQMGSLSYLQEVSPHYVKLDQSLSFYSKDQQNNELIRALVSIVKGLDISVIITAIENDEQRLSVQPLHCNGYQGYICPPETVVNHDL